MQHAGKDTKEENKRVLRDGTGRDGTYLARLRRALWPPLRVTPPSTSSVLSLSGSRAKSLGRDKDQRSAAGLDNENALG